MSGKQAWTWDEIVLVLDVYLSGANATEDDPKVKDLIQLLSHPPGSVRALLRNFSHLDGKGGLSNASELTQRVWGQYARDRHGVRSDAKVIRKQVREMQESGWSQEQELLNGFAEAPEGRILTRYHLFRERNHKAIREKKQSVLRNAGRLVCEACGFDFAEKYGKRGEGFIECHHLKPVSELKPGSKTRQNDLALLCSNCHRMVHVSRPWLKMKELAHLIESP